MQSLNNVLNHWLNSSSYNELIKNTNDLAKIMKQGTSFELDENTKEDCVQLFKNIILKENSSERISPRFINWFAQVAPHALLTPTFVLQKLKGQLSIDEPEIDIILSEMLHATTSKADEMSQAVKDSNLDYIKELISSGTNFDVLDKDGATPLGWAAFRGQPEMVELLLTGKVNVDLSNIGGQTPLMLACGEGNKDIVEILLKVGADPNHKDNNGYTSLYHAAIDGNKDIVEILLNNGADVNLRDKRGRTTLVSLTYYKHTDVHQQIAEMLAVNLSPVDLLLHKEMLRLIALAHSTNRAGISQIKANGKDLIPVELEGATAHYWLRKMSKCTKEFSFQYPELLQNSTSELLIQMLKGGISDSNQVILERHKTGLPVLISTGFVKHEVSVLIWGNYFILCNRGGGIGKRNIFKVIPVTKIHQFVPQNLNNTILDKIKGAKSLDEKAYSEFFFKDLPILLEFKPREESLFKSSVDIEEELEQVCFLAPQTSGNCTWAAPELAVLTFFMINDLLGDGEGHLSQNPPKYLDRNKVDEVKAKFDEWAAFNQMYHLERYLGPRHLRSDDVEKNKNSLLRRKVYEIDNPLLLSSIISIIRTIPFRSERIENLNHILAKTLILNDKEEGLSYAEVKNVMDALFEPNAEKIVEEFTEKLNSKPEEKSSGL